MSVKVPWILAGILCLCTLVALWVTAARVKGLKMAARYGERTSTNAPAAAVDPSGSSTVTLRRDERVLVGHFSLEFPKAEAVRVLNASGVPLVEFPGPRKGEMRRWQELQLVFGEVGPAVARIDVGFAPGSPCYGGGRYLALRQGLQIQFPGGRSVTVTQWDAAKPEATLRMEGPGGKVDSVIGPGANGEAFRIKYQFDREGPVLDLKDLD